MSSIPDMIIHTPYDGPSTAASTQLAYNNVSQHSSYIRLSKGGEPTLYHATKVCHQIDKWSKHSCPDFVIITHGSIASCFLPLESNNLNYDVLALKDLSPDTSASLMNLLQEYKQNCKHLVFCEEAFPIGSFSSSFISTYFSELSGFIIKQKLLPHRYLYDVLDRDTILSQIGFTPTSLSNLFSL